MRTVICGYVPEEGRVSMMRTASSITRHVQPLLEEGDVVTLHDARAAEHALSLKSPKGMRLKKRVLAPLRHFTLRADVVHIVDNDYAFGIAPWQFRRTVVTCHDLMPYWLDPTLESIFKGPMGRYFYRATLRNLAKCAHVACVSEFTRQALLARTDCRESQTSVIPQAVEKHFRPLPEDDSSLRNFIQEHDLAGKKVILHVGSCFAYKNIPALLEVVKTLAGDGDDDMVLLKIGGHFSDTELIYIEKHRLGARLIHLRDVSEDDLVVAYNAASLLLWPSHFEGFGLPVLEAMACGTPVVCANGGALAEVAADKACVHEPNDIAGMADSCRAILGDPERASTMSLAGIDHAAEYSWELASASYYDLYKRVSAE